jgi:hypothetical protein
VLRKLIIFTDALRKEIRLSLPTFFFSRKLVNATIKSEGLRWLRSTDENLKYQHKQFCKYVASFRKINSVSIQLEVEGKHFNRILLCC